MRESEERWEIGERERKEEEKNHDKFQTRRERKRRNRDSEGMGGVVAYQKSGREAEQQTVEKSIHSGALLHQTKVTKKSCELSQFHSDVSHHEVLEDGCHLLYCSGEMGSATCSPDSRWRLF